MRPANVLQPVLASISDDPEHPSVKSPPHLGQVLIGLDEADLEDVLGHVRAAGHAQRVAVKRVAIATYEDSEGVAVARENSLDDLLIRVVAFQKCRFGRARDGFRRLHDDRISHFPRAGQWNLHTARHQRGRHGDKTTLVTTGNERVSERKRPSLSNEWSARVRPVSEVPIATLLQLKTAFP